MSSKKKNVLNNKSSSIGAERNSRVQTEMSEMSSSRKSQEMNGTCSEDWADSNDYGLKRKLRVEKEKLLMERAEVIDSKPLFLKKKLVL